MKRAITISGKVLLGLLIFILVFLVVSIAPVSRTLPSDQPFYKVMMQRIDSLHPTEPLSSSEGFNIGFGKASITPSYPTATAGYVKRKGALFTAVQDSVYARSMVIKQGEKKLAIVSLDMLIVPPLLYNRLVQELPTINFSIDQVYLGATHTHNSFGQWDDHLAGEVYAGDYDPKLIDYVSQQILLSIQYAEADTQPAQLKYGSVPVREAVTNRLIRGSTVDSLLHIIEIKREDSTKGIFTSFTAHATCMSSKDINLSRDYPGALVDKFEANGYAFAMFMAGAVGSHAPVAIPDGKEKIDSMSSMLFTAAIQASLVSVDNKTLEFQRIPLLLGKQQVKVLPDWRVREWLSLALMGEHIPSLTVLQMGNIILLGTPCDFSGLLTGPIYREAQKNNLHAFATSFNGGYIGYITPDEYYDAERYETQTMNWYGPGNGTYIQECLIRMMRKIINFKFHIKAENLK